MFPRNLFFEKFKKIQKMVPNAVTMSVLPRNVIGAIKDHGAAKGLREPKFDVSSGSRNGDSYSGDVYRIVISPDGDDLDDCRNNNSDE